MTEMVDRVALAMISLQREWDELNEAQHEAWRGLARAAIAAMSEPTLEMVKAGVNCGFRDKPRSNVENIWLAMIDAAGADQ